MSINHELCLLFKKKCNLSIPYDNSKGKLSELWQLISKALPQSVSDKLEVTKNPQDWTDEIMEVPALRKLLNASKRWTEVDYKMSGFTKEHEWHDLTPLAKAGLDTGVFSYDSTGASYQIYRFPSR